MEGGDKFTLYSHCKDFVVKLPSQNTDNATYIVIFVLQYWHCKCIVFPFFNRFTLSMKQPLFCLGKAIT